MASLVSLSISSPTPLTASAARFAASLNSPLKTKVIALPSMLMRSITTLIVAPMPAVILLNISAPSCVLLNMVANDPTATTSRPMPVAAIAPLRVVMATTPLFAPLTMPLKAVTAPPVILSS